MGSGRRSVGGGVAACLAGVAVAVAAVVLGASVRLDHEGDSCGGIFDPAAPRAAESPGHEPVTTTPPVTTSPATPGGGSAGSLLDLEPFDPAPLDLEFLDDLPDQQERWEAACRERRTATWLAVVLVAAAGVALVSHGRASIRAGRAVPGLGGRAGVYRREPGRALFVAGGALGPLAVLSLGPEDLSVAARTASGAFVVAVGALFVLAGIRNRVELVDGRILVVRVFSTLEVSSPSVRAVRARFLRAPATLELAQDATVTAVRAVTGGRSERTGPVVRLPGGISSRRVAEMLDVPLHPNGRGRLTSS